MARFNARRFSSPRFFGTSDTVRVPEAGDYGILFTRGIYLRSTRHGAYYYTGLVPSPIRVLGKVRTTITATREKFPRLDYQPLFGKMSPQDRTRETAEIEPKSFLKVDFQCRLIFICERMLIK